MKKVLLSLVVLLFIGCGDTPSDVAMEFSQKFADGKIQEAKSLGTQTTASTLDLLVTLGYKKDTESPDFEVVSEEVNGDSAKVVIKNNTTNKSETFDLVKQDGEWKVDLRKQ